MSTPDLVVLAGPGASAAEEAAVAELRAAVGTLADMTEAQLAEQDRAPPPRVVLLLASLPHPLALARRLRARWPLAHLVIAREEADLPEFRRSLGAAPMLGTRWSLASLAGGEVVALVRKALAATRQQHLFRAQLDAANAKLAATHTLKRSEFHRLVQSENYLAHFLRHSQDAVIGFDAQLVIVFWSRGAETLLRLPASQAHGRSIHALGLDAPGLREHLELGLGGADVKPFEITCGSDARILEVGISAVPGAVEGRIEGVTALLRDVTQQRRAEQQLRSTNELLEEMVRKRTEELEKSQLALIQAQKLDALGKLTGGVAHDFNNVLQVAGANLQLLEPRVAGDDIATGYLKSALSAVERGAKLSSQLLAFARRQPLNPQPLNVGRRVQEMDELLRRALGEQVQVETIQTGALWTTLADPVQLENVILNLAINARDAMPAGGRLTIETANVSIDDSHEDQAPELDPGHYVMLAISDTGTGMPPEVAAHAFEPFFTTKPEGKGTGLGLSMAYGFAKQSGGHIRIYSEVGVGTTIKLFLPRTHEQEVRPRTVERPPAHGGTETILVVEDDLAVQSAVVSMLHSLGYRTLRANDAQAALHILQSGVAVDLLFTDVVMPGPLRSPELASRAKAMLPGIAVLFTSGYTQNAIVHGGRLDPGVELLSKPYRTDTLARKVRKVLDAVRRQAPCADDAASAAQPGRREVRRVLLVDDEEDLRTTTVQLLELLGYEAVGAPTAEEGERLLAAGGFDVLITDLSLPGKDGVALARSAARMSPDTAIVFCTGYGNAASLPDDLAHQRLPKPFSVEQLRDVLARVGAGTAA